MAGVLQMVKTLTGQDDVATITGECEAIRQRALVAFAKIDEIEAHRARATSEDELSKCDRAIGWQKVLVDRAGADLAAAESRLTAARVAARDRLLKDILAALPAATKNCTAAGREFKKAFDAVVAIKTALADAGFPSESAGLALPGHINGAPIASEELLQRAEAELQRHLNLI